MKHINESILNEALKNFTVQPMDNQTPDSEFIIINADSKMVHYYSKEKAIETYQESEQDDLLRILLNLKPGNFFSQGNVIWVRIKK